MVSIQAFNSRLSAVVALLTTLFLAGCSIPQPDPRKEMTEMAPTGGWDAGGEAGPVANDWIATFNDSKLVDLVNEAQEANPDLAATAASLSAAIAQARQANSALFPQLDAGAVAKQFHIFELTEEERFLGLERNDTELGISLDLAWELDVWGRISDSAKSAALSASATAADYAAARQSLAGQVAKGWFQAITAKQQLELAEEFVANFAETFRITEARFNAGDVSAQDTFTAKADLANSRQDVEEARFSLRFSIRSLEILLGRYPSTDLSIADSLGSELVDVPAGLPSTLLERRPDLIAADRRVASAFFLANSASAARLPQFSLSASYQSTSDNFGDLFDAKSMLVNIGLNLFQPLFDAGLRRAEFEEAEADQMVAVATYQSTALSAFQEVEDALSLEKSLFEQVHELEIAAESYEKAREIGEIRYREGETDLTSLLVVQREALAAQADLLTAQGQLFTNRVDLYLALGGNFEEGPINDSPAPPPLPSQE
ncbi:MAG: TolC family protein [Verrucomicrobiota bacterium]